MLITTPYMEAQVHKTRRERHDMSTRGAGTGDWARRAEKFKTSFCLFSFIRGAWLGSRMSMRP